MSTWYDLSLCRRYKRTHISACLLACAALAGGGCNLFRPHRQAVLQTPAAKVSVDEFAGNALSGALPRSIDGSATDNAWTVDCRIVGTRAMPVDAFQSVGPAARLIVSDAGGELMAPTSRLIYSTTLRELGDEPGAIAFAPPADQIDIGRLGGAVTTGSTVQFHLAASQPPSGQTRLQLEVSISRGETAGEYQLAIRAIDRASLQRAAAAITSKEVHEMIVTRRKMSGPIDHIALGVPMRFPPTAVGAVVIELTIDSKPDNETALAADLKKRLDDRAATVAETLAQHAAASEDQEIQAALTAFAASGQAPRASLAYLAGQSGASLANAVILVADEQLLTLLAQKIRESIPRLSARDRVNVAWMLDSATVQTIASIKDDETNRSLPAVRGALESYAGEAGRQLDVLQSLANQSRSSAELNSRITAEQLIDLEDESPATRVRAFDWLAQRQLAPMNFDPLGPGKARRAALEAFHDAAATRPAR